MRLTMSRRRRGAGDSNRRTFILTTDTHPFSPKSLNDGESIVADHPSASLFDNDPFNWGDYFKNKHDRSWPVLDMHPVTPLNPDLEDLQMELEKTLHTQHVDLSSPFLTPPVLDFGNTKIDINKDYTSTQVSSVHTSGAFIGIGIGCLLVLLLIAGASIKKKTRSGTVPRSGVVGARAVQQHPKTDMRPSGQAGPASNDLPPPYSECINQPVSEDPPPFLTDTELLAHNNHLFETGFTNKCVAMTTAPNTFGDHKTEFVFDNGRIVERLSVNETGHGTRRAEERDCVVCVDEHSKAVL